MPTTTIRILLGHTKWDKDELLSKLTDENRSEFFARANVTDPFEDQTLPANTSEQNVTCGICFMDFQQKVTFNGIFHEFFILIVVDNLHTKTHSMQDATGLGCGHKYCEECWRQYLTIKITDEGAAESIQCPTGKCGIIVDDDFILRIISDENVCQRYQHLMTNSFVQVCEMNIGKWSILCQQI